MTHYRKLAGERCYLSPVQLSDAEAWTAWMNDLEVTVPLGDEAYIPCSLEKMQAEAADAIQHQQHVFSIVDCATDRLIGRRRAARIIAGQAWDMVLMDMLEEEYREAHPVSLVERSLRQAKGSR